ncbi:MAG: M23 family metallopeptidase [Patescibacteria group bacterium]
MILVKSLIVIKRLLYGVAITILRPIFLLFKFLLTKPLIKLYYLVFKLKKSGIAESPWQELIRRRALHVLVFSMTLVMVLTNIVNANKENENPAKLANKTIISHLVKNEFSTITDDSELIEQTLNMKQLLASGQERYRDFKTVIQNRLILNEEEVVDDDLAYAGDYLVSGSPFGQVSGDNNQNTGTEQPVQNRSEIIYYTVNNGDTISSIAKKFGISVNTILWSNNLTAFSLIRAGNQLSILPTSGVTYKVKSGDTVGKIARNFGVEEDKIFQYNNIKSANGLVIGQTVIIPGGKQITASSNIAKAVSSTKNNAAAVIEKLVNPKKAPASGAKMAWPTEGHRITQYYSWRHTGLDIANKVGTPLYAAEAGKVEFSGWSNGYGNNVVINHGGGKKTRYAHASKLFVKVGESVERGEQIANMGSTGWSTGSHIHFEVIINGTKYNPLSYIK